MSLDVQNLSRALPAARRGFGLLLAFHHLFIAPSHLHAAANDNNIEWNGVFSDETFRQPKYPGRGESFAVELRVFRGDITSAKVRTWDGTERKFDLAWNRHDGPYDIWRASVAGSMSNALYYRFELSDGSDTDYYNRLGMSGSEPATGDFLVNLTPLGSFPLGASVDGDGVVFRVWAPNATNMNVAGQFNSWSTTAHRLTNVAGVWQTRVSGARADQEYQFVLQNGTFWRTDPRSRRQVNSVGNSIVRATNYLWAEPRWHTPPQAELIIYELHIGTFCGSGDGVSRHPARFRDAAELHLQHLAELGVNAVELMPVNEFAGDISWGYNPSFQFAIESAYGSPDDLKYLIDRCHQAGLAVLMDVVFNHMGGSDLSGNLLNYDGTEIYFYPPGNGFRDTPWGPRPDYGRREVREYLAEAIRAWLEEYHVDGFRLDATDFIKVNTDGWRVLQDVVHAVETQSRGAVVLAEQLPNDNAVTVSIDAGGAGADAQWNDGFHDSLRAALGAAAFGDPNMTALVAGMNHFGFGGAKAVNYIESHDEVATQGRAVRVADSSDPHSVWAYGRGKLVYGLTLFTAGLPMVLQGQEFMEDRPFGDTAANNIQWGYKQQYADYFLACRDMTWLRRRSPALRGDSPQNIFHLNEPSNVIAWHRWNQSGDDLVFVASFNNNTFDSYCVGLPLGGEWLELFNSDAATYGGSARGNGGRINANGGPRDGLPFSACVVLPRMGLLVFGRRPVTFVPIDADDDGIPDIWEQLLGLNPNLPEDGQADPDLDGADNRSEYRAGTDLQSAASVFRVHTVLRQANTMVLRWQTVPGRTYLLQTAAALPAASWSNVRTFTATTSELSHTNSLSGVARFFRVQVMGP